MSGPVSARRSRTLGLLDSHYDDGTTQDSDSGRADTDIDTDTDSDTGAESWERRRPTGLALM